MNSRQTKFHSLSRRIVWRFCWLALGLSAVFGGLLFMLLYDLEDTFLERGIHEEAASLVLQYQQQGNWPATSKGNMQLYFSKATFPEDIRELAISEPQRKEFYGQNSRHYHIHDIPEYDDVYLVAEVSGDLLVRHMRKGILMLFAVVALLATVVACVIAWLIGRKMTAPLQQLSELVDGVAPERIPQQFADRFAHNEIGILARTLEDSLQRMTQALTREKSFTRDVSHELRTPLAVIKNAVELQQSQHFGLTSEEATIHRIQEAAEHMEKTVQTLLMLAREEQSRAAKEITSLMPIIEKSVLDNCVLLDGKDVAVNIDDSCQAQVYAQPGMLKVLMDNLLSNAFQYTQMGNVSVEFDHGQLIVSDTGPGIENEISGNITEPGVKGQQSNGIGLGLSIVQRLCDHQDWQLNVTGENGTRVAVILG